jgi:hypothetical protein
VASNIQTGNNKIKLLKEYESDVFLSSSANL